MILIHSNVSNRMILIYSNVNKFGWDKLWFFGIKEKNMKR